MDTLVRQRGELSKTLLGGTLGFILLAGALALWHETFAAANFFASVFAVLGLLALGAGGAGRRGWPTAGRAMRMAGAGALVLALAASLSLGSFLPPRLAEWLSPPLGRFGGALALGVLAGAACVRALVDPTRRRRALDLAAFLAVGALWLRAQTARQIDFPPAPTTAATVAGRLQLLLVLSLALGAIALVLAVYRRRGAARVPVLAAWSRDWAVAAALLGLGLALGTHSALAPFFALPCVLIFGVVLLVERSTGLRSLGGAATRRVSWLALVALTLALGYGLTAEDLEVVFLRNTVERRVLDRWAAVLRLPSAPQPNGNLSGIVRDQAGRPLGGATVVVATIDGRAFSATSAPDGRYTLTAVPTGNYLPLAVETAHEPGGRAGFAGRVATVRPGRETAGVDFALRARAAYDPATNDSLQLGSQTPLTIAGLVEGSVLRRPFTYANRGKLLDGGLIHEPPAEAGPGPFPILLIIYPGEAASWEGVSAPLAARGFVVVSYFPRRLLDLEGDLDDLRLLFNLVAAGQLSARGDRQHLALAGGSVSTVYTYLLAERITASSGADRANAVVQYGGLFDLYAFRHSWESGAVIIDPGISELEYLLVAFGRPDTRPEIYLRLSPRYRIAPTSLPPTLLVHAERDIIVPAEQSHLAATGYERAGIPHRLLLYPALEHYLDISKRDPAQLDMLEQTIAFLQRWDTDR